MATFLRNFWQNVVGPGAKDMDPGAAPFSPLPSRSLEIDFQISPEDPLLSYFQNTPGAVEIEKINIESPALSALKESGIKLVVPLVSQGELIGLLNMGSRRSEQEYSADDQRLLNNLAGQAAPALRVAQLVRQQQAEARTRERLEQEMKVARVIQETLLPKEIPVISGWEAAAYWQPARAVGGDFYDFIDLPDDRLGLVIGDVTDKGVPAALVMATTRSILRGAAERFASPGEVLGRVNNLLCGDIPRNMFVTCLYAILDPKTGHLCYANAGHNLPYRRSAQGIDELRATGMPLGLMPEMPYDENETQLSPGESVLFYSDGLVEAHNSQREMFSFNRLKELVRVHPGGSKLVEFLLTELANFTGDDWEQEDDVTFVTLERKEDVRSYSVGSGRSTGSTDADGYETLAEFNLPSEQGRERQAMERVASAISGLGLSADRLERLKTAVAEATMNAIEHGNQYDPDLSVNIKVLASEGELLIKITDLGGEKIIPKKDAPDLEAKLAGLQSPRGWGLFLIQNMVDDMQIIADQSHHTVVLTYYLKGDQDVNKTAGS
jgi:serine phosphatase RsbU (regulator of sigma subunit)/anti-sigma regulatory factor (Ser/Thr protein kinase)